MADDDVAPTPSAVTAAVSVGTAPLPFIAVYAALFVLHGAVHPVHPPDIGNSPDQELVAGLITTVLFVVMTASLVMFLNRKRRWFYAALQVLVMAGCIDVLIDSTKGGRGVALLLVLTTVISLFFGFAPDSWTHVRRRSPAALTRLYARFGVRDAGAQHLPPASSVPPHSSPPTMVEPATLRRRRFR